jgi:O-antigen/teichoic acid export membrane protein
MRVPNRSLRAGFAWSFTGNAVNGVSQWAILALIAKLTSTELLGQYALAVAVAMPLAMLAHLNLRSVLATDVDETNPFADYLHVRVWVTLICFAITLVVGLVWRPLLPVGVTIIVAGVSLGVENVQDLYYGVMQRRDRLDLVAQSMILRALLSVAAVAVMLHFWHHAVAAATGVLAGRLVTCVFFDMRFGSPPSDEQRSPWRVFRIALPLGFTLMLISLTSTVPRYFVEHTLGTSVLGTFVAINSFVTVGSVIMNALGQSAITRLARAHSDGDLASFRKIAARLVGLAVLIGLAGALVAQVAGEFFLALVYRPEFRQYKYLLVQMLLAGTLGYVASILGFVVTSTRQFTNQLPLLIAVAATSALVSFKTMPDWGLTGAVVAVAAAALVQTAGNLLILRKAL